MNELSLALTFNRQRPELRAIAYRILGSLSDGEDAVQEAWLRLQRTDADQIESLEAWLTTVVARICLNMLRARRRRGEQPLDSAWPELIIDDPAVGTDPEHEALLADSVGIALQVVLDTLTPAERLAFVLHDMFAVPFDEIAAMVDRSPQATRQLASRARHRVREAAPAPDPDLSRQHAVVDAYFAAAADVEHPLALAHAEPLEQDVGDRAGERLTLGPDRGPVPVIPAAPLGLVRFAVSSHLKVSSRSDQTQGAEAYISTSSTPGFQRRVVKR
jgi:RNA polymerase sigma factor (sigma-70 family)